MLALAIVAALILAATGVAMANIPDTGTGIFHGCVATNGSLRVIDPSKGQVCNGTEQSVSWNSVGINWKGFWSSSTAYVSGDAVSYGGSSYIATAASSDKPPPAAGRWSLLALEGPAGADGNTILHGAGRPADSLGKRGDFYLDTTAHLLYGPKFRYCRVTRCTDVCPQADRHWSARPDRKALQRPAWC